MNREMLCGLHITALSISRSVEPTMKHWAEYIDRLRDDSRVVFSMRTAL